RRMRRTVSDSARRLGFDLDPDAPVDALSVGARQRVELLKALRHPVRALILDEPTAVLTPAEIESLFGALRRLRARGCAFVFISPKLGEIMALCDRVTVLRHGRTVATRTIAETSAAELAALMVGHAAPKHAGAAPAAGRRVAEETSAPILKLRSVRSDP